MDKAEERRAAALRQNLRRRKEQARARVEGEEAGKRGEDGGPAPDTTASDTVATGALPVRPAID